MFIQFHQVVTITGVYIENKKLAIIPDPKSIRFNLIEKSNNNLRYEIDHIIKHNELLAEQRTKNETKQLLYKREHAKDIHE